MPKMGGVARYGENLRRLREGLLKLNQKELGDAIRTKRDTPVGQYQISKFEREEYAPKTDTLQRYAAGIAHLSGRPVSEIAAELLKGVRSRYDTVTTARVDAADAFTDRLSELIGELPDDKRQAAMDAIEERARVVVSEMRR